MCIYKCRIYNEKGKICVIWSHDTYNCYVSYSHPGGVRTYCVSASKFGPCYVHSVGGPYAKIVEDFILIKSGGLIFNI